MPRLTVLLLAPLFLSPAYAAAEQVALIMEYGREALMWIAIAAGLLLAFRLFSKR